MSSDLQPVRIGLIGAGGIVKSRHMPGLRAIPGVSITKVSPLKSLRDPEWRR
jgi:predicted dehydrogenase